jgi:hypothetical protein
MKKVTLLIVLSLILALSACKLPAPGGGIATATTVSQAAVAASATPGKASEATKPPEKGQPSPTAEQPLAVTATPGPTQEAAAAPAATATATTQPQAANPQAKRVEFKVGTDSATLEGVLNGGETLTYVLAAKKGQTMQVDVWSPNGDVFLAVSGASSGQVLAQAADRKDSWGGTLPQDEDFYVSLTAGNGQTSYKLTVKIPALSAAKATPSGTVFDPYATYGKPKYEDKMAGGSLLEWAKSETGTLPDNNSLKLAFKDGKLYVTGKQIDFSTWWFTWHSLKDFYLEMTFDTQQCQGSDAYGTIIRGPEHLAGESYGYVVAFSCEGNYWIFRLDDADPWDATDLISWAKSDAINTGVKAQNILGIRAEGKTLTFFANGYQIAQVTDDEYSQGRFGVFVRSSEDGDYTYRVLKVAYWELGAK